MKKRILVVTSSFDETVTYLTSKFSNSVKFFRINVDCISEYHINLYENGWEILSDDFCIIKDDIDSIYYRKPAFPKLDEFERKYWNLIKQDVYTLITGIIESFEGKVLSKPSRLLVAENKAYQYLLVQKLNLLMPQSYIGNSIYFYNKFADKDSIIKPLSQGKVLSDYGNELYFTSKLDNDKSNINISKTPVYIQEKINKIYDVRIIVIDGFVFAIKIDAAGVLDWRVDYSNHQYSLITPPQDIVDECKKVLSCLSLSFGAFDYVVTQKNEWIFLEVNPNGQWLWLEQALKLNISEKIINYLTS